MNTILFRCGNRFLREWWVRAYGYPQEWNSQTWMIWSSVILAVSYYRTIGLSRSHRYQWKPFPEICFSKIAARAMLHVLVSWGMLWPVFDKHPAWSSCGRRMVCQVLRLVLADPLGMLGFVRGLWVYSSIKYSYEKTLRDKKEVSLGNEDSMHCLGGSLSQIKCAPRRDDS